MYNRAGCLEGALFLSLMQVPLPGVLVSRPWMWGPGKQLHDPFLLAGWVTRYILELGVPFRANLGDSLLCPGATKQWPQHIPLPGSGKAQVGWALGNGALPIVLVSWKPLSQITTNSVLLNNHIGFSHSPGGQGSEVTMSPGPYCLQSLPQEDPSLPLPASGRVAPLAFLGLWLHLSNFCYCLRGTFSSVYICGKTASASLLRGYV